MRLDEMAEYITNKVNKTDSVSVGVCKTFLRQRWQMIYNSENWRWALRTVVKKAEVIGKGANAIPTSYIIMPFWAEKVIGVKISSDNEKINSFRLGLDDKVTHWMSDPSIYDGEADGNPTRREVGFVMAPDLGVQVHNYGNTSLKRQHLAIIVENVPVDSGKKIYIREESSEQFQKANPSPETSSINGLDIITIEETFVIGSATTTTAAFGWISVLTKEKTTGRVSIYNSENDQFLVAFQPQETGKRFIRIELVPWTFDDTNPSWLCLVKKRSNQLIEDGDQPEMLAGVNCLLAFAQADMLERARQYAKAQVKIQEGSTLLADLRRQENELTAGITRIIPYVEPSPYVGISNGGHFL